MNKHLGETFYADICDVVSINGQGVWKLTGNFHLNSMMLNVTIMIEFSKLDG